LIQINRSADAHQLSGQVHGTLALQVNRQVLNLRQGTTHAADARIRLTIPNTLHHDEIG
jgi:hypothetical protein